MTTYESACLARHLCAAGLDYKVWMPRIRLAAGTCDIFARLSPDNKDCFHLQDGRPPEDCRCYVRLVPPRPETAHLHPAPSSRDEWTAVLDACCFSHQAVAADWQGYSPWGFRLTAATSRPAALKAAADLLSKIAESPIDGCDDDDWDEDEPWDGPRPVGGPWPVDGSTIDAEPARIRCLLGFQGRAWEVCSPCEEEIEQTGEYIGATRDAKFLLTADNELPRHLEPLAKLLDRQPAGGKLA